MKRRASGGFTIVESLIVLGISAAMFVIIASMVGGQQAKVRFRAAVGDVEKRIQQQINEVASGFYPSTGDIRCMVSGSGDQVSVVSGAAGQGTNNACVFLGSAMMYAIPGTDPQEFRVHTLVGLRVVSGTIPTTLRGSATAVLAPGQIKNSGWPDKSTVGKLTYGATVSWMRDRNNTPLAGFAIVTSPTDQLSVAPTGMLASGGTISPSIIPIRHPSPGPQAGVTPSAGVDAIIGSLGNVPATDPVYMNTSAVQVPVRICLRSGTTNQSALLTVGANQNAVTVVSEIMQSTDCT